MKIQKLKEIIREEVKKALRKENSTETAPAKEKEKTETGTEEPGTVQPGKPQFIPDKDRKNLPSTNPKAKTQQKKGITAKDFVNKYNKLKGK